MGSLIPTGYWPFRLCDLPRQAAKSWLALYSAQSSTENRALSTTDPLVLGPVECRLLML